MDELEEIIGDIVARKNAAPYGSAERRMYVRQLVGLRSTHEQAGHIIQWLDPIGWGESFHHLY
jgi:hypothetical protein